MPCHLCTVYKKGRGKNTKITYAWTNDELTKLTKKGSKGTSLQRFKGLGK